MNPKMLVKISNIIGIVSIILLIYWVFTFISIEVFGLKVFRENLTESFYFSILGILALMTGALIVNIMFNLTRIAEKHNDDKRLNKKISKRLLIIFGLSFPLIFGLLYTGDYLTSRKKEKMLVDSAEKLINDNKNRIDKLLNYEFNKSWVNETHEVLEFVSSIDTNFPNIEVVVKDKIDKTDVYLGFSNYYLNANDTIPIRKVDFIQKTTQEERDYLKEVFENKSSNLRFSASDGDYELFYPYSKNGKRVVFYFSDYQRYGKFGS